MLNGKHVIVKENDWNLAEVTSHVTSRVHVT